MNLMGGQDMESIRKHMGNALKSARIKAGITITEAAEAIGKTNSTMYSYELSRIQPTADVFLQLVLLYGVDSFDAFLPLGMNNAPVNERIDQEGQEMLYLMQNADEQGKAAAKAVLQTFQRKDAGNDAGNIIRFIK